MSMRYLLVLLIACNGSKNKDVNDPMKHKKTEASSKAVVVDADGGVVVDAQPFVLVRDKLSAPCQGYFDALAALKACAKATDQQKTSIETAFSDLVRNAQSQAQQDARDKYCTDNVDALKKTVASAGC